jgi:hypothetical protein
VAKSNRKQKLKVFRTPIGFHDAFVAAPSQKAALEAWGADSNLFAQGVAEQVSDPDLTKVPLENPGQVVKVLRGTRAEQLAALDEQKLPKRKGAPPAEIVPLQPKKRAPKPSREPVEKTEEALAKLEDRHAGQVDELEKKLRDLRRRHERERDEARQRLADAEDEYREAMRRYERG